MLIHVCVKYVCDSFYNYGLLMVGVAAYLYGGSGRESKEKITEVK